MVVPVLPVCPPRCAARPGPGSLVLPQSSSRWILGSSLSLLCSPSFRASWESERARERAGGQLPDPLTAGDVFLLPTQSKGVSFHGPGTEFSWKPFSLRHLKALRSPMIFWLPAPCIGLTFPFWNPSGSLLYPSYSDILQRCFLVCPSFVIFAAGHLGGLCNLKLMAFSSRNFFTMYLIISYLLFFYPLESCFIRGWTPSPSYFSLLLPTL